MSGSALTIVRDHVDQVDDGLGPVVAGGRLGPEDEGRGGEVRELPGLELAVNGQDGQGVHELALVLVQALHLHVKEHLRVDEHALAVEDLRGELRLFQLLEPMEAVAEVVANAGTEGLQAVQVGAGSPGRSPR